MAGADDTKTEKPNAAGAVQTVPSGSAGTVVLDPNDAIAATQAAEAIASGSSSLVGTTIANRYKVLKRLGEGGMGTVYEVLHTVLEKPVALKVLHPEMARKSQLVDRFLQEAKAASRIRHENVIDISDFGSADGHVYFAMELLRGHDLHEEITRARTAGKLLPWARTKSIFLQICSALAVAHERGIVHRDLKPENVYLVEFRGDPDFVKLLDFGIAKMTDVSTSDEGRKLTKTGMLFGTPEYMAPEQARGETADHRVDIYAMGCILFLLVSNRLPFQAENFMGVLSQHLTEEPPEIAPETFDQIGAPREIADVIDRALEKDREDRWQTIDELAAAICEICGDPPPRERSRPHRAPSVDAPGETTRNRTPTDPTRSRTPSGSQRFKSPTGPRPRTPTGAGRSKPPTSPPPGAPEMSWVGSVANIEAAIAQRARTPTGPVRPKGQTPPPGSTPEVSWVGNAAEIEKASSVVRLDRADDPEQKGHVFAIVSAIAVVATIGVAGYFLWFHGTPDKARETGAETGSGSTTAETAPQAASTNVSDASEPLPLSSKIVIDSVPQGATITALPDNRTVGRTPHTLTLTGSTVTRQYKLALPGYDAITVDVVPNKTTVALKPQLVRAAAGNNGSSVEGRKPPGSTPAVGTGAPVIKPDVSTAITKPETPAAEATPERPAPPADETAHAMPEAPKPAPDPAPPTP